MESNDLTFWQVQVLELTRLLEKCKGDPILEPQYRERLREAQGRVLDLSTFSTCSHADDDNSDLPELKQAKQVLVVRNDLKARKGKLIAQGGHAAVAFLLDRILKAKKNSNLAGTSVSISLKEEEWAWIGWSLQAKICLKVESEDALLDVYRRATEAGLTVHMITDAGLTEFKEPTRTCLAIGPNYAEDIDKITGELQLL